MQLADILTMQSLKLSALVCIKLSTAEAAGIVIEALAASRLHQLTLLHMILPNGMDVALANALMPSHLVELKYQSLAGPVFLQSLSDGLGDPTTTLQKLGLGSFYDATYSHYFSSISMSLFLQGSHLWRLREVTLYLSRWDDAFGISISRYVETNPFLQKLTIHIAHYYTSPSLRLKPCSKLSIRAYVLWKCLVCLEKKGQLVQSG
jgi:hypothetical protein